MSAAPESLSKVRRRSVILTAIPFLAAYLLLDLREGGRSQPPKWSM